MVQVPQFSATSELKVNLTGATNRKTLQKIRLAVRCGRNDLKALESMGLTLPSPLYILGSIFFGIIGYIAFRHGRKSSRIDITIAGVALMMYPYAVSETWILWVVGVALTGWVFATWQ
jgi:hypothetical protein